MPTLNRDNRAETTAQAARSEGGDGAGLQVPAAAVWTLGAVLVLACAASLLRIARERSVR